MARICVLCGKKPQVVNNVSNANNKTKRWVYPNVHSMRFTIVDGGCSNVHRGKVCTKCVKAGKVKKVI
jgi:large subunit ribosomal protein L28